MTKGHIIFNTGISGTDLPQYAAIAEHYIEILQPDIVITNLCYPNDFVKYDRKVNKDLPVYYLSNVGAIYSCPMGVCFDNKDEIVKNLQAQDTIPVENSQIYNLMAKTRITTGIWALFEKKNMFGFKYSKQTRDFWEKADSINTNGSYSVNRKYLEKIDSTCQAHNAQLVTSIIPSPDQLIISDKELNVKMDGYQPYLQIKNLELSDYKQGDGHFNEKGHKKYAEFLDSLIQAIPKKAIPE